MNGRIVEPVKQQGGHDACVTDTADGGNHGRAADRLRDDHFVDFPAVSGSHIQDHDAGAGWDRFAGVVRYASASADREPDTTACFPYRRT